MSPGRLREMAVRDAVDHGTHNMAGKKHCIRNHEFTPENTRITKRGGRECRACRAAYFKTYQRKSRVAA